MQRQKVVLDAKLDNVTGSRSNPRVTLMFSSVQVAAFNGDQNMSGNVTFISSELLPPPVPHLQAKLKFCWIFSIELELHQIGID